MEMDFTKSALRIKNLEEAQNLLEEAQNLIDVLWSLCAEIPKLKQQIEDQQKRCVMTFVSQIKPCAMT